MSGGRISLNSLETFSLGISGYYEEDEMYGLVHVFSIGLLFISIDFLTKIKEKQEEE